MHEITTCDRSLDLEMVISCIRQTDVASVTTRDSPTLCCSAGNQLIL
jgi:hypothetical protein